jgi:large repetitive protein
LTNDGTYTVTLSTTNACGTSTDNVQYVVVSPPTVSINAILAGCAPYTVDPSANYDAGGGVLNPAQWTFQNGSPATFTGADSWKYHI